jgi:hypothetical protein
MSDRSQWKMLHLLNLYGKPALHINQMNAAGINCYNDTIMELLSTNVIQKDASDNYSLSMPASSLLNKFIVANKRWKSDDLRVDYPECFVVMPFSQPWSAAVYNDFIEPAVKVDAGMDCVKGDDILRIDDLSNNVWNSIVRAGLVICEISAPNPNVFYELGLAHAMGKDCFLLFQKNIPLPADIRGAHYYAYDLNDLAGARKMLADELVKWRDGMRAMAVKGL